MCYFTNCSHSILCVLSVLKGTENGVWGDCYIILVLIQLWYITACKQEVMITLEKEENSKSFLFYLASKDNIVETMNTFHSFALSAGVWYRFPLNLWLSSVHLQFYAIRQRVVIAPSHFQKKKKNKQKTWKCVNPLNFAQHFVFHFPRAK